MLASPVDAFAAHPHQRHCGPPRVFADGAKLDGDLGVAIGVAGYGPIEAEIFQRGVLDEERAGDGGVLGGGGAAGEEGKAESAGGNFHDGANQEMRGKPKRSHVPRPARGGKGWNRFKDLRAGLVGPHKQNAANFLPAGRGG